MPLIDLSLEDLELLCSALDSHTYWQLSDSHYRHDGYVREPGSDDEAQADEIAKAQALEAKLSGLHSQSK